MKRKLMLVVLAAVMLVCCVCIILAGAAGTSSDPLISVSYLYQKLTPQLQESVGGNLKKGLTETEERLTSRLDALWFPGSMQGEFASQFISLDLDDGDVIELEDGLTVSVIRTAGHSCDEISYLVCGNMFIGDSVPVKGDIPIFIDEREMRKTLHILKDTKGVKTCYPAWDQTYTAEMMEHKLNEAGELIDLLKKAVSESDDGGELPVLVDRVCNRLKMPMLKSNPLFSRTIECLRQEA